MKKAVIYFMYISLCFIPNVINAADSLFTLYPAVTGAVKSKDFAVSVNGKAVFVEKMARFDVPVHYVRFGYNGGEKISMAITANQVISSFSISPKSKNINGVIKGKTLQFTLDKPQYLVVTINSMEYLFLLIDSSNISHPQLGKRGIKSIMEYGIDNTGQTIETKKIQQAIDEASASGRKRVIYFPAGIYLTGQLNMKSNVSLYLEGGALIKGSVRPGDYESCLIRFDKVSNVQVTGHGTIDGSGWDGLRKNGAKGIYLLFLSDCNNILIDGPLLRDPCFWNTRVFKSVNVHLRNIKIINNRPAVNWTNTDGVDFDSSSDCDLINSIMHTGDDNMVVKGLDNKEGHNTERILFQEIIGLSNSAAAKIGTETRVRCFNNIIFNNIDIIKCKRAIVIDGFDSSTIRDIKFLNLNIEGADYNGQEGPRIIDIEVTNKSWRECVGRCRVRGVLIKNLNVYFSINKVESFIYGRNADFNIKNVIIQNFRVQGKLISSFKEGNILVNDFVSKILFQKG
jgi:polygalacturonase